MYGKDALSCRFLVAKEPLFIGLFCGILFVKIRHPSPMRLGQSLPETSSGFSRHVWNFFDSAGPVLRIHNSLVQMISLSCLRACLCLCVCACVRLRFIFHTRSRAYTLHNLHIYI